MGHELGRLAAIEVIRHPRREQRLVAQEIFPRGGAQVERFQRLVKFEAGRSDRAELFHLIRRQWPRLRRELPRLVLEERLRRE
jgi:hypothetical protein